MKAMLLALLLLTASACGGSGTPSPATQPATAVAQNELDFQSDGDDTEMRAAARKAATDFLRERTPEWTVKGIHLAAYRYNVFWAVIDARREQKRRVIELEVIRFFPENGEPYWGVNLLTNNRQRSIHDADDEEMRRQLNDALAADEPGDEQ